VHCETIQHRSNSETETTVLRCCLKADNDTDTSHTKITQNFTFRYTTSAQ